MTTITINHGAMKGAILCIADESEPFLFRGKWFVMSKMWGPFQANQRGDPSKTQPSGRTLQAAYEFWKHRP